MDKILLLVSDWKVRQLYHELLFSKNVEINPTGNISDATVMLMMSPYQAVVVNVDQDNEDEVKIFLSLRSRNEKLSRTSLILLSPKTKTYPSYLQERDSILDPSYLSIKEVSERIKALLKLKKL